MNLDLEAKLLAIIISLAVLLNALIGAAAFNAYNDSNDAGGDDIDLEVDTAIESGGFTGEEKEGDNVVGEGPGVEAPVESPSNPPPDDGSNQGSGNIIENDEPAENGENDDSSSVGDAILDDEDSSNDESPTDDVPVESNDSDDEVDTGASDEDDTGEEPPDEGPKGSVLRVTIDPWGDYEIDPTTIQSVRPDIFEEAHFSIFDLLIFLDDGGIIQLTYHFDEDLDTHVIDDLNGKSNWWYYAYYDGGWSETNVYRMDYYTVKDLTTVVMYEEESSTIQDKYSSFEDGVKRLEENDGQVILPRVTIDGPTTSKRLSNVIVTAHDLRNDSFVDGVITAIDVIMSLGDQMMIEYGLGWWESIGSANVVKNYFVEKIDDDEAYDSCGWVYETGELDDGAKNHIHIPPDQRVILSPEYEEFFWICLG